MEYVKKRRNLLPAVLTAATVLYLVLMYWATGVAVERDAQTIAGWEKTEASFTRRGGGERKEGGGHKDYLYTVRYTVDGTEYEKEYRSQRGFKETAPIWYNPADPARFRANVGRTTWSSYFIGAAVFALIDVAALLVMLRGRRMRQEMGAIGKTLRVVPEVEQHTEGGKKKRSYYTLSAEYRSAETNRQYLFISDTLLADPREAMEKEGIREVEIVYHPGNMKVYRMELTPIVTAMHNMGVEIPR